jgi:hypothetical protein
MLRSLCKKRTVVSGRSRRASSRRAYSCLAFLGYRKVILVVILASKILGTASKGVTILRPSSPFQCLKQNDYRLELHLDLFWNGKNLLEAETLFSHLMISVCYFLRTLPCCTYSLDICSFESILVCLDDEGVPCDFESQIWQYFVATDLAV